MKVFIPLNENDLPPCDRRERLVPYQVGFLVLSQLSDGTPVWTCPPVTVRTAASADRPASRPAVPPSLR